MSLTEILVVMGGLALGYWVVAYLIKDLDRDEKNPLGKEPAAELPGAVVASGPPWHEVLKVPPDAAVEEIGRSYELLMEQYHPDKVATLGEELKVSAERKSKEINAAYQQAMQARGEDGIPLKNDTRTG